MVRPVKKTPEQWRSEILKAAKKLFMTKGYEETFVSDIMEEAGGAKGMFYRCFESKEAVMYALGNQMFFENDPFDAVRERTDLNGLQKIKELLAVNLEDQERNRINAQAAAVLKDPRILSAAVAANREVLTPLWFELLEEGVRDGSVKTAYAKELSELLPLINFWFLPSVFPANEEELRHKYRFVMEVLSKMGLPILDDRMRTAAEGAIADMTADVSRDSQTR